VRENEFHHHFAGALCMYKRAICGVRHWPNIKSNPKKYNTPAAAEASHLHLCHCRVLLGCWQEQWLWFVTWAFVGLGLLLVGLLPWILACLQVACSGLVVDGK
jgi:hypothetical protein